MTFNSTAFLIFFPVVTTLYFLLPGNARRLLLLAASVYFYMYFVPKYILVLLALILIDYVCGLRIEAAQGPSRKRWLVFSLVSNLSMLFVFKYFNCVAAVAHFFNWDDSPIFWNPILLPLGLSFHTFQAMSYTIEVYRGRQKAERSLLCYALYVLFYPQLVAGPIERPGNLLHQFRETHRFEYDRVVAGLRLMLWGLFKKAVIADRLAVPVNEVFNHLPRYHGLPLVLSTVAFAFQIFCDFSGYSDIAIGAAQVMGFRLMVNFDRPYLSRSIPEFWHRWHISLSSWFRDYVYIPLGGNRVSPGRRDLNLMITFLLSGLWHGSNWTFAVWGALNGAYQWVFRWAQSLKKAPDPTPVSGRPGLRDLPALAGVFALTCFAWIFFRANSLSDAFYVVGHLGDGLGELRGWTAGFGIWADTGLTRIDWVLLGVSFLIMEWVHVVRDRRDLKEALAGAPPVLRWALYYFLTASIAFTWYLSGVRPQQFIYFQF